MERDKLVDDIYHNSSENLVHRSAYISFNLLICYYTMSVICVSDHHQVVTRSGQFSQMGKFLREPVSSRDLVRRKLLSNIHNNNSLPAKVRYAYEIY